MRIKCVSLLIGASLLIIPIITIPRIANAQNRFGIFDAICWGIQEFDYIIFTTDQKVQLKAFDNELKPEREALYNRYTMTLNTILTTEQRQQLEDLYAEDDYESDTVILTTEQETQLEVLDSQFSPKYEILNDRHEIDLALILTSEQRQQYRQNLAAIEEECER